jgi:hypothetical protein
MRLKIIADGKNPKATKIVNTETDEMLEDVLGVEISIDGENVEAALIMSGLDLEIDNLEVQKVDTEGDGRDGSDSDN